MSVQQDSGFLKAFSVVLGALVLFTISIGFLANSFSANDKGYKDPLAQAQMYERLRPVGQSRIAQ